MRRVAAELRAAGVETVAVSYLHAYAAPGHERRTAELLREELPDVPVTISSDVSLQGREYERTNTTAVNAYLAPVVGTYLRRSPAGCRSSGSTRRSGSCSRAAAWPPPGAPPICRCGRSSPARRPGRWCPPTTVSWPGTRT